MANDKSSEKLSDKKGAQKPRAEGGRVALDLESANEVGFLGYEVDPTPDENYSVAGVIADKPTPENDGDAFAKGQTAAGIGDRFRRIQSKGGKS